LVTPEEVVAEFLAEGWSKAYSTPEATVRPSFNSNFYLTAATVIPVLYVALILQAPIIRGLLNRLNDEIEAIKERPPEPKHLPNATRLNIVGIGVILLGIGGLAILLAGVFGEMESVLALFRGTDTHMVRQSVLRITIVLLICSAIAPAWTIVSAFMRVGWSYIRA
jgi:hypothetical protein